MMGMKGEKTCPDCGVKPGEQHDCGCDVERCSVCGGQRLQCSDDPACADHRPKATKWTGEWPGKARCRELGWWCVGPPWVSCPAGTPGATEDLNRLAAWEQHQRQQKGKKPQEKP